LPGPSAPRNGRRAEAAAPAQNTGGHCY
jgi:hypothetical protein